jgi:hypothetical protein
MVDEEEEQIEKEFYLETIRKVVDQQKELLGKDVALMKARQAPLEIDKDNEVRDFYGRGEDTLKTLVDQYGEVWGDKVARRKVRSTVKESVPEEKYELLPDYLRPSDGEKGIFGSIIDQMRNSSS